MDRDVREAGVQAAEQAEMPLAGPVAEAHRLTAPGGEKPDEVAVRLRPRRLDRRANRCRESRGEVLVGVDRQDPLPARPIERTILLRAVSRPIGDFDDGAERPGDRYGLVSA